MHKTNTKKPQCALVVKHLSTFYYEGAKDSTKYRKVKYFTLCALSDNP